MDKIKVECSNCTHWVKQLNKLDITKNEGQCKRFPPTAHPIAHPQGMAVMCIYPTVQGVDYCGEYKPTQIQFEKILSGGNKATN